MTRNLNESILETPRARRAARSSEQLPMNIDDAAGALKAEHMIRQIQDGPRSALGSTDARAGDEKGWLERDGSHPADAGRVVATRGVGARDLQGTHRAVLPAFFLHVLHDLRVFAVVCQLVRRHRLQQAAPPPGHPPFHTSHTQQPSLFKSLQLPASAMLQVCERLLNLPGYQHQFIRSRMVEIHAVLWSTNHQEAQWLSPRATFWG